jgi:hypothetical protein
MQLLIEVRMVHRVTIVRTGAMPTTERTGEVEVR